MCNAPGQCGKVVVWEQIATEPAPPTGGAIADGTYVLTNYTFYTGPGGATGPLMGNLEGQGTYVFTNGAVQETVTIEAQQQPAKTDYLAGTVSTAGTKITFARTCPDAGPETPGDYSASTTQIRIVFLVNGAPEELLLDRVQ